MSKHWFDLKYIYIYIYASLICKLFLVGNEIWFGVWALFGLCDSNLDEGADPRITYALTPRKITLSIILFATFLFSRPPLKPELTLKPLPFSTINIVLTFYHSFLTLQSRNPQPKLHLNPQTAASLQSFVAYTLHIVSHLAWKQHRKLWIKTCTADAAWSPFLGIQ